MSQSPMKKGKAFSTESVKLPPHTLESSPSTSKIVDIPAQLLSVDEAPKTLAKSSTSPKLALKRQSSSTFLKGQEHPKRLKKSPQPSLGITGSSDEKLMRRRRKQLTSEVVAQSPIFPTPITIPGPRLLEPSPVPFAAQDFSIVTSSLRPASTPARKPAVIFLFFNVENT